MGALATVLEGGGGGATKFKPSFIVDFENAQPSDGERDLYNDCEVVIQRHPVIIDAMRDYKGCGELIKNAIQSPTDENKATCWKSIVPNVIELNDFYNHSKNLGEVFPRLIDSLCSGDSESFNAQQSLVKQLAHVIDFAMAYDDIKMTCPAISNDFSYFRRSLSSMQRSASTGGGKVSVDSPINDETANFLSLFYANPTPMLNVLKTCVQQRANAPDSMRSNLMSGLSLMANICYHIVEYRQFNDMGVLLYCLRAAVGSTILVDSLYEPGIFHPKAKKAPISAKRCVEIVKGFQDPSMTSLINALRYNTKGADPRYFE